MATARTVTLFVPCLVDQFYPEIAEHVFAVLDAAGFRVEIPAQQTCCGQPAYNAGYRKEATRVARHFIRTFAGTECIVAPSGSCVSMIKNHYSDLDLSSRELDQWHKIRSHIFEFSEFLNEQERESKISGSFPFRVFYHASCHGLRELGIREAPTNLLSRLDGIELVDTTPAREQCCGFGGIFSMHYHSLAVSLGQNKLRVAEENRAGYLVTTDAGCLLHLAGIFKRQQSSVVPVHLATVLFRAMGLEEVK